MNTQAPPALRRPADPAETADLLGSVPRQTMRDVIAQKLGALITSGVFGVGDELPAERALAEAMEVSRDTVRGAIQTLAGQGVLRVVQGSRTTVARTDIAVNGPESRKVAQYDLGSVHAARLLIERQVIAEAATRITAKGLDRLARSLVMQQDCLADPLRFLICDREFHVLLYRACGNPVLADIATDLYTYQLEARRRAVSMAGAVQTSICDHRAIFFAMEARDPEAAMQAMAVHEDRIYQTTKTLLAEG